ncbi:MAG: NVEALA domain-containing protein [Tannerella sp.]|nr:NVEALA domain-containing protein [Tannerella sp.]
MKKIFLYLVAVVAITAVAVWNVSQSRNETVLTDVAMENVEALADSETSGSGTLYGNEAGTRFCCCPGSNSCGASSCSGCPS